MGATGLDYVSRQEIVRFTVIDVVSQTMGQSAGKFSAAIPLSCRNSNRAVGVIRILCLCVKLRESGVSQIRKVASFLERRWNDLVLRHSAYLTSALIVAKEKQLVFHDRETERSAELITFKVPTHRVEVTPCIQLLVAQKFVGRTMNLVGSRLGYDVDDATGEPTILRIEGIRQQPEFLDRVEGRHDGSAVKNTFLHVPAVYQEGVGGFSLPVYG